MNKLNVALFEDLVTHQTVLDAISPEDAADLAKPRGNAARGYAAFAVARAFTALIKAHVAHISQAPKTCEHGRTEAHDLYQADADGMAIGCMGPQRPTLNWRCGCAQSQIDPHYVQDCKS